MDENLRIFVNSSISEVDRIGVRERKKKSCAVCDVSVPYEIHPIYLSIYLSIYLLNISVSFSCPPLLSCTTCLPICLHTPLVNVPVYLFTVLLVVMWFFCFYVFSFSSFLSFSSCYSSSFSTSSLLHDLCSNHAKHGELKTCFHGRILFIQKTEKCVTSLTYKYYIISMYSITLI